MALPLKPQPKERDAPEALPPTSDEDTALRQAQQRAIEWALRGELVEAGLKCLEQFRDGTRAATLGDVVRALELACRLGRLSCGLPNEVKDVNETITATLDVEWEVALTKVCGEAAAAGAVVEVETASELPTPSIGESAKADGEGAETEASAEAR